MILTHPIYRLLKQVLQKTAWEPSLHLLFCFSPQRSESTKPQLRGRCFRRDHVLMNCERLPCLFPSSCSRCAGGWEGLCARLCSARQAGMATSLRGTEQKVTLNVRVSPLSCAQESSSPASLISPPHHALINSCLPNSTKNSQRYLGSWLRSRKDAKAPPVRPASLPPAGAATHADWARLALGGIYLTKHTGKPIKGAACS